MTNILREHFENVELCTIIVMHLVDLTPLEFFLWGVSQEESVGTTINHKQLRLQPQRRNPTQLMLRIFPSN